MIAKFINLHQGSTVSFTQQVAGRVANIPNGMDIWLVVYPVSAPAYWPQRGPLRLDPHGQFHALAYFGLNSATYKGEEFVLVIVETTPAASQRFQYFDSHPQGFGLSVLPDGTRLLTEITVIRS